MAEPQIVRITGQSGSIEVVANERTDVSVSDGAVHTDHGDVVEIHATSGRLVVEVPLDTDLVVGTQSGRVTTRGRLGAVRIIAESGRVSIASASEVDVRTGSSRIDAGEVRGSARVRTTSGQIAIRRCSGAVASTESGRIEIGHADGPVEAHCVSGRITITMDAAADVDAETVSGRIRVRYPTGVRVVHVDRAATTTEARLPEGDCSVRTHTVSGRVEVSAR